MIYTKMSTLSPVYAKSRHVYILVQDFRLFSAMPKVYFLRYIFTVSVRSKTENRTVFSNTHNINFSNRE